MTPQARTRCPAPWIIYSVIFGVFVSACGQNGVRLVGRTRETALPAPSRILVYTFASSANEATEFWGPMRQQPAKQNPAERRKDIVDNASETLAADLADGLRTLGFVVERVERGTTPTDRDLLIDGEFLTINQGNPLLRLMIGFGSGASKVEARLRVYQGSRQRKLLEFTTVAESGKLPGAATTLPAGAIVQGSVSSGLVAGSAIGTGFEAYRTDVRQLAGLNAEQAVRYLSEFFARQGWISSTQVKKARLIY